MPVTAAGKRTAVTIHFPSMRSRTGGEFGVEASAIAAAGYCAVSLLALMLLKKKRHS